jgi:hypothetical protein
MTSVLNYSMSEQVVMVISLQSWQYCHWQSFVKMAVLMLLNSLYLLIHPPIIDSILPYAPNNYITNFNIVYLGISYSL